jgi:hypothetical protein
MRAKHTAQCLLVIAPYTVDVMQKVANTLKYAEIMVGSGRIYVADQSNLPVELRSMWIGGKEPPFPHGDNL